jgi:hypothetical protein
MKYLAKPLLLLHKFLLRLSMKTFYLAWDLDPELASIRPSSEKTSETRKTEEQLKKSSSECSQTPRFRVREKTRSQISSKDLPQNQYNKTSLQNSPLHSFRLQGRTLDTRMTSPLEKQRQPQISSTLELPLPDLELALNYLADPGQVYPPQELEYLKPEEWQLIHQVYLGLLEEQRVSNEH